MREPGVEPGSTAWKAVILPLNYPRTNKQFYLGFKTYCLYSKTFKTTFLLLSL